MRRTGGRNSNSQKKWDVYVLGMYSKRYLHHHVGKCSASPFITHESIEDYADETTCFMLHIRESRF